MNPDGEKKKIQVTKLNSSIQISPPRIRLGPLTLLKIQKHKLRVKTHFITI